MKVETVVRAYILICLTIVLTALVVGPAEAADTEFRLSWTPPTERQDGSPLDPATELSGYELVCGDVLTEIPATVDGDGHPVAKADALPGYGNYDCTLAAVDTENRKSPPSDPVAVEWVAGPGAPTELIIFYGAD